MLGDGNTQTWYIKVPTIEQKTDAVSMLSASGDKLVGGVIWLQGGADLAGV
jgi:hypothetical protein